MTSKMNLINIFNDKLYNYKNKTYISFVRKTIKKCDETNEKQIKIEYLDEYEDSVAYNELFMINEKGEIRFFHKENLTMFINKKSRFNINNLLNINIKNQRTYEVIKVLQKLQKEFFISDNLRDLSYIKYEDIIKTHNETYNAYLSKPIISNILNNGYYRNRNNKILPLLFLTPKKSFLLYIRIKYLLSAFPYASDKELKQNMKDRFDIEISVVQIAQIRKKYFIPKKSKRKKRIPYVRFDEFFSSKIRLKKSSIKVFQNLQAVYELSIESSIDYSYNKSNVVYIGSSKNIYKRFIEYVNGKAHTSSMRDFFDKNEIYIRYIKTQNHMELEKTLLNEFYENSGSLPLLNKNNLTKHSRYDISNDYSCFE